MRSEALSDSNGVPEKVAPTRGAETVRPRGAQSLRVRRHLTAELCRMIGDTGLNQTQTAKWLQVDQSRISQLLNRQLVHFSTDTLLDLLARARVRVDVVFDQRDKSSDADSQSTSDEILPRTGAR